MPFVPKNEDHAIVEAVFGLSLARPFTTAAIEKLQQQAKFHWPELPKISRSQNLHFALNEQGMPVPPSAVPGIGIMFERIQPDGTLGQRLNVDAQNIFINFLEYPSWADVWPIARKYFEIVAEVAGIESTYVKGVILQYIDLFNWNGEIRDYRADLLFNTESEWFPKRLWTVGPLWHLHHGRYISENLPLEGKSLQRMHIDANLDIATGDHSVRIDNFLSIEPSADTSVKGMFVGAEPKIDTAFDFLHDLQKTQLKSLLREDVCAEIGL